MLNRARHHNSRIRHNTGTRTTAIVVAAGFVAALTATMSVGSAADAGPLAAFPSAPAPVGDLPGWRQIFRDDFTTDVPLGQFPERVRDRWGAYPSPWTDSTGKGEYSPDKVVSIDNGVLNKYLHVEKGQPLVAALTPKVPGTSKNGTLYGRYEVRFRADRLARGWKMAWLLWPDSGTTTKGSASGVGGNGEINWPEKNLDSMNVWGFVHHQNATTGSDQKWFKAEADIRAWHTYTIEWSPNLVVLLLDGKEVGRTTERVPNTPMHWVLQTETWFRNELPTQGVNIEIDWVSVWEYAPGTVASKVPPTLSPAPSASPIRVTSPTPGATVSGDIELGAAVEGAEAVKWYVDGNEVDWDGSAPWSDQWNSASVSDGTHQLFAKAKRSDGTWDTSTSVSFGVANGDASLALTFPAPGATVSGNVRLTADASGVTAVKWYVDGKEIGYDAAIPWADDWDSRTVSDGWHRIFAKARDGGGRWIETAPHDFRVDN